MKTNLEMLNESFDHLQKLEDERRVLMATLHMWHQVMLQGVDHNEVVSFGFSLEFVKQERFAKEPWAKGGWYNYVTLKDGTKKRLEPFVKAPAIQAVPSEAPLTLKEEYARKYLSRR